MHYFAQNNNWTGTHLEGERGDQADLVECGEERVGEKGEWREVQQGEGWSGAGGGGGRGRVRHRVLNTVKQ